MQCINLALIGISRFPDLIFKCVTMFFILVFEGTGKLSNSVQLSVKMIKNNLFLPGIRLENDCPFQRILYMRAVHYIHLFKMFFPFFYSG